MKMRRSMSMLVMVGILGSASTLMIACDKPKGPAEKAGEKIDNAIDNVSDAIDPKGPMEKAGRAIDRATDGK